MTKAEEQLKLVVSEPNFLCVSGSRLYGTNREDSDWDYRGYTIPPFEYLIGYNSFACQEFPETDHKIYSLKRFLELALGGDPLVIESFFVPVDKIIIRSLISSDIFSLKDDIISQSIYNRIFGYSHSEWRKTMGVKVILEKRDRNEDTIINDIREIFKPDKGQMDTVITTLYRDREKKIVPSQAGIGGKRKEEFDKYGYGVSSACHSIRLLEQLYELCTTGNITFPRPNAEFLKNIRYGKYTKEEIEKIYEEIKNKVEQVKDKSILSLKPNHKKVWSKYLEIISHFLKTDYRFLSFPEMKKL